MFEILVFYCDPSFYISVGSLLTGLAALINTMTTKNIAAVVSFAKK